MRQIFQDSSREMAVSWDKGRGISCEIWWKKEKRREEKGWLVSVAANDESWQPWDGHKAGTAGEARKLEVLSVLEPLDGCFLHPWAHLWQRNTDRKEEMYSWEKGGRNWEWERNTATKLLLISSQGVPRRKVHSGTMECQEGTSHPSLMQEKTILGRGSKYSKEESSGKQIAEE